MISSFEKARHRGSATFGLSTQKDIQPLSRVRVTHIHHPYPLRILQDQLITRAN